MTRSKKQEKDSAPLTFDVAKILSSIKDSLEQINKKLDTPVKTVEPQQTEARPEVTISNGFPIPVEYQEIVDTLLNKKFKVDIGYLADAAAFSFSILVPREYSNASQSHWDTYKEDKRTKVIQNAYGANGVREWVLHVYENFPPEIKSAITFDRGQIA